LARLLFIHSLGIHPGGHCQEGLFFFVESFTFKLMNRIDRVTAILIQLQSRRVVKAQDIAERFKISLRTVYRDIKTLEQAGVPLFGEAGVGYSIMDGFRLPPVMFTREEAAAFLTGEKLMEKFTDPSTGSSYKSAMYKVRAVLRSSEKDMLENIEGRIEVIRKYAPPTAASVDGILQTLLRGISEKKVLHIRYAALHASQDTERNIEPVGVFFSGGYWHALAYCRLRSDYRDFRTDRVVSILGTEESFVQNHPSLSAYLQQLASEQKLETVVLGVDACAAQWLEVSKYYNGFVSERQLGSKFEMTFLTPHLEGFARWFLTFADQAEILSPDSLGTLLKQYVGKIAAKL
jgi:predicted DNA-binding transcriptional regulator YafY